MNQANIKAYNPALHNVRRAPKCAKLRVGSYLATNGAWDRKYVVTRISLQPQSRYYKVGELYPVFSDYFRKEVTYSRVVGVLRVEYTYIGRYFASKSCRTNSGQAWAYNNGRVKNHRPAQRNTKNVCYVTYLANGTVRSDSNQVHVVPKDFKISDLI
jgi:hypothetical protein